MAHSNQTIHDLFDALRMQFVVLPMFEDVEPSVLDAEEANETRLDDFSNTNQEAAA